MNKKLVNLKEAILFKGHYDFINQADAINQSNALYDCINDAYTAQGFTVRNIESNTQINNSELISPNTEILIGHSIGSLLLLNAYDHLCHLNVRRIILLEPTVEFHKLIYCDFKNVYIFLSKYSNFYYWKQFKNVYSLDDNHYFSSSLPYISKMLKKLV